MFRLIILGGFAYVAWLTIRENTRKREEPSSPLLLLSPRAALQHPLASESQEPPA